MPVLRFLATGDIQAHAWRQFSYTMKSGMNSRLYQCLRVFDIIVKEAKKRDITKVLINGDIFEENAYINVEVYDAVYQKLEMLHDEGLDTVVNLGNHDVLAQLHRRMLHSLRPLRGVAHVVEKPTLVWKRLQVVPWMADPEALKRVILGLDGDRHVGLCLHCGVQGARTGPKSYLVRNPIKLRDVRPRDFAVVILSDYHITQRLRSNVFYLGSPLQHTFGEVHRPCIWELRIASSGSKVPNFSARKIFTDLPQFKTVVVKSLRDLKDPELDGNYVKAILPADSKLDEGKMEAIARGRFQLQPERRGEEEGTDEKVNVHTLTAEEAIFRYTEFHSSGRSRERLAKLGQKLYEGEV